MQFSREKHFDFAQPVSYQKTGQTVQKLGRDQLLTQFSDHENPQRKKRREERVKKQRVLQEKRASFEIRRPNHVLR